MHQFKALLMKDIRVNMKSLLMPLWIIGGAYVLFGLVTAGALFKGNNNVVIGGIPLAVLQNSSLHQAISFGLQVAVFFSFIGLLFGISIVSLSGSLLNQDIKHKCELFHRSMPVNIWKIAASRYIAGIGGMIIVSLAVGIVNMLLVNIIVSIATPIQVDWWLSLNGMLLSWLHLSVGMGVLGSLCFVLSSLFRDNAIGKGLLGLAGIEVVVRSVNFFMGLEIPSLIKALVKLVDSGVTNFGNSASAILIRVFNMGTTNQIGNSASQSLPPDFLARMWGTLFTGEMSIKLLFCVVMFVLATCIYHRREIQF